MGDHAFVQNHAINTEVSIWKGEKSSVARTRDFKSLADSAELERVRMQRDAANRAAAIMKQCTLGHHEYFKAKGFEDETGNILMQSGVPTLVIPMRVDGSLVGCQMIDIQGGKKFLYGQRTSNAEFIFNNKGMDILCEGFATALSVRAVMKSLKRRYTIHVCFSAGNMKKIASTIKSGVVIADNDESKTGERVAQEIGWPYWMSDQVGEDANDTHLRVGLFNFSQSLLKSLNHGAAVYR